MIETEISISVNRKSDIDLIEQKIIENKMKFPVYIREYEFSYQINFTSDYEEWELDRAILDVFPEHEYITDLERGRKEIRIQISRYQSELSRGDWGWQTETPLNETKYLVKKSANKPEKFSPKIKVLFEDKEQYYFVNIVEGINKVTDEKGFLLSNDFTINGTNNAGILKDKLYTSPGEAFQSGFYKVSELVDADFRTYLETKKKEIKEIQKLPRKIIRDFINACNSSNENRVLKNLDENLVFEKLKDRKTIIKTCGISEFKEYLSFPDQQLYGKNFKVRSYWSFNLPVVTIGVKYFLKNDGQQEPIAQRYEKMKFVVQGNRIKSIEYEG